MRKMMLRLPAMFLAGISCFIVCLVPATAAPLITPLVSPDSAGESSGAPAREALVAHLESLGLGDAGISRRLDALSDREVENLALSLNAVLAGGETETRKAAGVAFVIVLVVGAIAGFYLFYNANK